MPLVVDTRTQHVQVPSHESLSLKNFTIQVWPPLFPLVSKSSRTNSLQE